MLAAPLMGRRVLFMEDESVRRRQRIRTERSGTVAPCPLMILRYEAAHTVLFDGRFLVPEGPVDLPMNQMREVEVTPCVPSELNGSETADAALIQERRRRLRASAAVMSAPVLSDDALRRENMYDDGHECAP